jgi:hypothetical protein
MSSKQRLQNVCWHGSTLDVPSIVSRHTEHSKNSDKTLASIFYHAKGSTPHFPHLQKKRNEPHVQKRENLKLGPESSPRSRRRKTTEEIQRLYEKRSTWVYLKPSVTQARFDCRSYTASFVFSEYISLSFFFGTVSLEHFNPEHFNNTFPFTNLNTWEYKAPSGFWLRSSLLFDLDSWTVRIGRREHRLQIWI